MAIDLHLSLIVTVNSGLRDMCMLYRKAISNVLGRAMTDHVGFITKLLRRT